MNKKLCILFSGFNNIDGVIALHMRERFSLKEYGGIKLGLVGTLFYADFDPTIDKEYTNESNRNLVGLFVWFGLKKIKFRFDTYSGKDSAIDYRIHMVKEDDYIQFPEVHYVGDK